MFSYRAKGLTTPSSTKEAPLAVSGRIRLKENTEKISQGSHALQKGGRQAKY